MKDEVFAVLQELLEKHKPETVCEIGTHKAATGQKICDLLARELAEENKSLYYTGYDVFDLAVDNNEFNQEEINGKDGAPMSTAIRKFNKLKKRHHNFDYELHKGLTQETLTESKVFDFVYIDGGHSYDTVMHDYSMVKDSKLIIFDDLDIDDVQQAVNDIRASGVQVDVIKTPIYHTWGVIVNE